MSAVDRLVALAGSVDVAGHTRTVDGQTVSVSPYRRALRSMSLNDLFFERNKVSQSGSRLELMLVINEIRKRQQTLDAMIGIIRPGSALPDFDDDDVRGNTARRPHILPGVTSYRRERPSDLLRNRVMAALSKILESP